LLAGRQPAHAADGWYGQDDERAERCPGGTEPEHGTGAEHGRHRAGRGESDRTEREGAHHVERRHAGQGLRGHLLLCDGHPERAAQRGAQPGEQRAARHRDDRQVQGQRERREREAERRQGGHHQRPPGTAAEREQAAEDRAAAVAGQDDPPG
jgi:hypothetical protein